MSSSIPPYSSSPLDSIAPTCKTVRLTFASQKTKPIPWRLVQLRKLYWAYVSAFICHRRLLNLTGHHRA